MITAWIWTALLMTWIRWLMRNLVRCGRSRIETWLTCCDMSLGALKQARADLLGFFASQAMVEQSACTDEHQPVDKALGAW
ncbi:hypothetical protein PAMH27_4023 [Pseudomonas aeruginosa MH27]|nr:hypothetical protein PAMH27_4023 [Pseudomonas aeruginosa MH27]